MSICETILFPVYVPVNNFFSYVKVGLPGLNQYETADKRALIALPLKGGKKSGYENLKKKRKS